MTASNSNTYTSLSADRNSNWPKSIAQVPTFLLTISTQQSEVEPKFNKHIIVLILCKDCVRARPATGVCDLHAEHSLTQWAQIQCMTHCCHASHWINQCIISSVARWNAQLKVFKSFQQWNDAAVFQKNSPNRRFIFTGSYEHVLLLSHTVV